MESETIDLTGPVPQVLKKIRWTGEPINNRLLDLAKDAATEFELTKFNNLTLTGLLKDCDSSKSTESKSSIPPWIKKKPPVEVKPQDTIVLSDDDESPAVLSRESSPDRKVTDVHVIELSDDSDNERSDKTDDLFDEKAANQIRTYGKSREALDEPCKVQKDSSVDLTCDSDEEGNLSKKIGESAIDCPKSSRSTAANTDPNVTKPISVIDHANDNLQAQVVKSNFDGIGATITPIVIENSSEDVTSSKTLRNNSHLSENGSDEVSLEMSPNDSRWFEDRGLQNHKTANIESSTPKKDVIEGKSPQEEQASISKDSAVIDISDQDDDNITSTSKSSAVLEMEVKKIVDDVLEVLSKDRKPAYQQQEVTVTNVEVGEEACKESVVQEKGVTVINISDDEEEDCMAAGGSLNIPGNEGVVDTKTVVFVIEDEKDSGTETLAECNNTNSLKKQEVPDNLKTPKEDAEEVLSTSVIHLSSSEGSDITAMESGPPQERKETKQAEASGVDLSVANSSKSPTSFSLADLDMALKEVLDFPLETVSPEEGGEEANLPSQSSHSTEELANAGGMDSDVANVSDRRGDHCKSLTMLEAEVSDVIDDLLEAVSAPEHDRKDANLFSQSSESVDVIVPPQEPRNINNVENKSEEDHSKNSSIESLTVFEAEANDTLDDLSVSGNKVPENRIAEDYCESKEDKSAEICQRGDNSTDPSVVLDDKDGDLVIEDANSDSDNDDDVFEERDYNALRAQTPVIKDSSSLPSGDIDREFNNESGPPRGWEAFAGSSCDPDDSNSSSIGDKLAVADVDTDADKAFEVVPGNEEACIRNSTNEVECKESVSSSKGDLSDSSTDVIINLEDSNSIHLSTSLEVGTSVNSNQKSADISESSELTTSGAVNDALKPTLASSDSTIISKCGEFKDSLDDADSCVAQNVTETACSQDTTKDVDEDAEPSQTQDECVPGSESDQVASESTIERSSVIAEATVGSSEKQGEEKVLAEPQSEIQGDLRLNAPLVQDSQETDQQIDYKVPENKECVEFLRVKSVDEINEGNKLTITGNEEGRLMVEEAEGGDLVKKDSKQGTDATSSTEIDAVPKAPVEAEEGVPFNLEQVRSNLKMQLSCLRTKKKVNILDVVKHTLMRSPDKTALSSSESLQPDVNSVKGVLPESEQLTDGSSKLAEVQTKKDPQLTTKDHRQEDVPSQSSEVHEPNKLENIPAAESEEPKTSFDLEAVRNSLKMQLTSLRTKKKVHILVKRPSVELARLAVPKSTFENIQPGASLLKVTPPADLVQVSDKAQSVEPTPSGKNFITIKGHIRQNFPMLNLVRDLGTSEGSHQEDVSVQAQQLELCEKSETAAEKTPSEDVRNNLKMQLTSLNTKKKVIIHPNVSQTIVDKGLNNDFDWSCDTTTSKPEQLVAATKPIASAKTIEGSPMKEGADQEMQDLPNVFNEIRKIIRKQKALPSNAKSTSSFKPTMASTGENSNDSVKDFQEPKNKQPNPVVTSLSNAHTDSASPFVSNTLDEFLVDSQLNVSYAIPKSGAEEGLSRNYSAEPVVRVDHPVKNEESNEKLKQKPAYKPKTLAEKRKIFERKKKLEEKRMHKRNKLEELQKRSYVLYKDEKVFVKGRTTGKCIAVVESTKPPEEPNSSEKPLSPSKPSLLQEYYHRKSSTLKYRPGPLSRKHLLQSDYSQWRSELKTLPTCVVHIKPQLGKPVHPRLLPSVLTQWSEEVSEDQLEFSLSAVVDTKPPEPDKKEYEFKLNYCQGQNKILVRKKIEDYPCVPTTPVEDDSFNSRQVLEAEVSGVVEDLIKYVEVKEIAESLIKDDDDVATVDEVVVTDQVPKTPEVAAKKKPKKISGASRELLRLNCKVISVDVKEKEPKTRCPKSYCQMGCVCESLACSAMIGVHCRKPKCMFTCFCPKKRNAVINITLPSGSSNSGEFLSADTVTRIEDEAKRNLAREEKEFTQTVIYSNDGAIVVGSGYKPRRVTKAPKKYTHFFEDYKEFFAAEEKPVTRKSYSVKPCSIDLDRWDFSAVTPYCLVHHLYDCHCKGYSDFHPKSGKLKEEVKVESRKRSQELAISASDDDNSESDPLTGRSIRKRKCPANPDYILWDSTSRSLFKGKSNVSPSPVLFDSESCARTGKVPKSYRRNKPFSSSWADNDFINNLTEADLLRMTLNKKNNSDSDFLDSDRLKDELVDIKRAEVAAEHARRVGAHKRKQQLQVRKYENIYYKPAEVAEDVQSSTTTTTTNKKISPVGCGRVTRVFPGEIIVTDTQWLKKLCGSTKQPTDDSYARILPWTALLHGYRAKTINIYCIYEMPLRLLLNVGPKIHRKHVLDIETNSMFVIRTPLKGKAAWVVKQSENVKDIVKWLVKGDLDPKYKATTLSFLLVETLPSQFEVRGLCTQASRKEEERPVDVSDIPTCVNTSDDTLIEPAEVRHKDMKGEVATLFITRQIYQMRELVEDGCDDDLTDNLYMWVGLPEVNKVAKWRVVFLNNDFVYLHFKNVDYSIKNNDLVKLTEIAKEENVTLRVRNPQLQRNHDHALYGIYVSAKYSDRIFVGPYHLLYDAEDVDTLKYMSKVLVSTNSLNKMKGGGTQKCGHWMYESSYNQSLSGNPSVSGGFEAKAPTTSKCEVQSENKDMSMLSTTTKLVESEQIVRHNGFTVRIKTTTPRLPSDFNRYIITNIPHFGYLGAFQPDNSPTLEVSWPFERKVLQFDNADNARDFLQERFNQLLQPVPETFKIQVIVLINLDLSEHKPIRSDFLNGQCICSFYGAFNLRDIDDDFCQDKFGVSKAEVINMFARRARDYLKKRVQELAVAVGIDEGDADSYTITNILEQAQREIKSLETTRLELMSQIQSGEKAVVKKITKLFETIKSLPPKYRNLESRILNEILQIRPQRVVTSGVIEIVDDDKLSPVKPDRPEKAGAIDRTSSRKSVKRKTPIPMSGRSPKVAKVAPFLATPPRPIAQVSDSSHPAKDLSDLNEIL